MEIIPPECSTDTRTPCLEKDWVGCAECGHLICQIHDVLFPVYYAEEESDGFDEVCQSCVKSLYESGEISYGMVLQYINKR
jgi:hypothetical protein